MMTVIAKVSRAMSEAAKLQLKHSVHCSHPFQSSPFQAL